MSARQANARVALAALFTGVFGAVSLFATVGGCASAHPSPPSGDAQQTREAALPGTPELAVRPDERPQPDPSDSLDPEIERLLTAHRSPDDAGAEPTPEPEPHTSSPCPPGRADTPAERSLCICERVCATTVDRQAIARRRLAAGADPEAIQRWLDEENPGSIHYPYVEIDGLRIDFAGDGRVLRCSHSVLREPGSHQALECGSSADPGEASSSVSAPQRAGS